MGIWMWSHFRHTYLHRLRLPSEPWFLTVVVVVAAADQRPKARAAIGRLWDVDVAT